MSERVHYFVGEDVIVRAVFYSPTDSPVDPGSVSLKVTIDGGAPTTYSYPATLTRDAQGKYSKSLALPTAGAWKFEWDCGAPGGVSVRTIYVS